MMSRGMAICHASKLAQEVGYRKAVALKLITAKSSTFSLLAPARAILMRSQQAGAFILAEKLILSALNPLAW